jgi:HEAT repeat protein
LHYPPLKDWADSDSDEERAICAAFAFCLFSDNSHLAIPELTKQMNDSSHTNASRTAVFALGFIGMKALPVLSARLADTNAPNREDVVRVLKLAPAFRTNTAVVIPLVMRHLDDPDKAVRCETIWALEWRGKFQSRPQPDLVVPALTRRVGGSSTREERRAAITVLGRYGDEAKAAVPALLQAIADPDEYIRWDVTNALMKIAPAVLTNAPAALHQ